NARSNASGPGVNAAIAVGGNAPSPAGLTSDYNDIYATGTGGVVGVFDSTPQLTLSDWQAATGQHANSISADPQYLNHSGNASTVDLHLLGTSPCVGAGGTIAEITDDFDGDPRRGPPTVGAGEPPVIPTPTPRPRPTPIRGPTPAPRPTPGARSSATPVVSTN